MLFLFLFSTLKAMEDFDKAQFDDAAPDAPMMLLPMMPPLMILLLVFLLRGHLFAADASLGGGQGLGFTHLHHDRMFNFWKSYSYMNDDVS